MAEKGQKNTKSSKIISSSKLLQQVDNKEKYVDIFLFFLLLALGIYHAVIYWGHQVVPHFDFECFASQGREILSFKLPADYKRVPLVGILQVLLGHITGGEYPDFHGGWLLNSIAHTWTIVLLWLAGRKIIGRTAVWFAIIAIINPFGLQLLTEAIAETTLLFFIWATFYLIFIRSKWAYLLASLTTMVRYEGAALILGAFVMDMIDSKDKKQRLTAFVYAALASAPLALWMLGTMLNWQSAGPTHYLNIFSKGYISQFVEGVEKRTGFVKNANILWRVGFCPLFLPIPNTASALTKVILNSNKILVFVSFLFGSVYGLYKRQWKILVLLIFLLPYFWIHAKYPYPMPRYYATIVAIVMLICVYGLCSFWKLVKDKSPKWAIIISQVIVSIAALLWALILFSELSKARVLEMSRANVSLLYIAILAVFIVLIAEHFAYKSKRLTNFAILALMILMITSSQLGVAVMVRDIEFKYLLDWYKDNAKKGEKIVTTAPSILQIMAPQYKDCFIHTNTFDANNPTDFAAECYERNITYVAWDSRTGFTPTDHYYKYWKMTNVAPLAAGKDIGPYQFIAQLRGNQRQYINLYRLRYPPPEAK
ncbi:MAG: hypothetical protein PHQ35_07955 [Phycisphaerae bacterium]|nr:hypothetical protein [Phycisphaerae bacterium]MDD5380095.1 hypothetical protein [Phycisphaerae bacterium]